MAIKAGVPLVPIACSNAHRIMKKRELKIYPGEILVEFLPPIDSTPIHSRTTRKVLNQRLHDETSPPASRPDPAPPSASPAPPPEVTEKNCHPEAMRTRIAKDPQRKWVNQNSIVNYSFFPANLSSNSPTLFLQLRQSSQRRHHPQTTPDFSTAGLPLNRAPAFRHVV